MKKRFKYLILSACLLLFIFCAVLYFKSNLRSPEFISIEKIEYIETIGPEVFFNAHANFYNPNNFEAQILNSELELISKDLEVAKISQSNISKVKAHKSCAIERKPWPVWCFSKYIVGRERNTCSFHWLYTL